jgi:cytochrome b subunit of formate dehydrogenase
LLREAKITFLRRFFIAGLIVGLAAGFAAAEDNKVCLSCHGQQMEGTPFVDAKAFDKSIHGRNLCVSCHKDATKIPHALKLAPVACRNCHHLESMIYLGSDHGKFFAKGKTESATCTSCHGKTHTLLSARDPNSPVNRQNIPYTCAACHANSGKMSQFQLSEKAPVGTYMLSVHGQAFNAGRVNAAVCSDCHGSHDLRGAANPQSKIYRANIPSTCGKCHENVKQVYERSVHGKALTSGFQEAPACTDCHGEHTILAIKDPASSVYVGAIAQTCSNCHSSARMNIKFHLPSNRLKSYQDSYHGLASRLGDLRAANCASCHGWHDILPSANPQSTINPKNLPQTCGKCHTGAQINFIKGKIHGGDVPDEHRLIRIVKLFYLIFIPLIIGGMFLFVLLDYIKKALLAKSTHHSRRDESILRMNAIERRQHGLLTVTFMILAYSGFSLKYPDTWFAYPFQVTSEGLRRGFHRWTALLFTLNGLWHIFYMLGTKRGRFILRRHLSPRLSDLGDTLQIFAFNVGLKKAKPVLHYPTFVERSEYWAMAWGSVVMIATGSFLAFNDWALKYCPLWFSNLATLVHFYEAVLACLALFVWHCYWVIYDPDTYPMNWSWLIGRLKLRTREKTRDTK